MVIHDRVIDDDYYSIICNEHKTRGTVPFTFINCDFVYHFESATFRHCKFTNCTFRYKSFKRVYFYDCDFNNIIFKDVPRKCIVDVELQNCHTDEKFKKDYIKTSPCPEKGEFIAWKKANFDSGIQGDHLVYQLDPLGFKVPSFRAVGECIIELQIPEDARRSCGFSNKCRCDKAKVLGIYDLDGNPLPSDIVTHSMRDKWFEYTIGKTVTPREPFDTDPFNECSSGIHFFMSREEAVNY